MATCAQRSSHTSPVLHQCHHPPAPRPAVIGCRRSATPPTSLATLTRPTSRRACRSSGPTASTSSTTPGCARARPAPPTRTQSTSCKPGTGPQCSHVPNSFKRACTQKKARRGVPLSLRLSHTLCSLGHVGSCHRAAHGEPHECRRGTSDITRAQFRLCPR